MVRVLKQRGIANRKRQRAWNMRTFSDKSFTFWLNLSSSVKGRLSLENGTLGVDCVVRFDIRYNGHSTVRQPRIRWSIFVYVVLDAIFTDPERTESIFPTRYQGQNEPFGMS